MASFLDGLLSPLMGGGSGFSGILSPLGGDRQDSITAMGLGLLSGRNNSEGFENAMQGFSAGRRSDLIRRGMDEEKAQKDREAMQIAQMAQKLGLPEATDPQVVRNLFVDRFKTREPRQLSFEERQFNLLPPDQQAKARERMLLGGGRQTLAEQIEERKAAAEGLGLKPGDPRYEPYVLGGKFLREDAQQLTATDKKELWSSEDEIPVIDNTLTSLNRALELNEQTYAGAGAGTKGWVGTSVPGAGLFLDENKAKATREFGDIMSLEAINTMVATLKGATTDNELNQFKAILADPSSPPALRKQVITRMMTLAQRKRDIAVQRVKSIGGDDYFDRRPAATGGGATPQSGGPVVIDGYTIKAR